MRKILFIAFAAAAFSLSAGEAEARLFEPQADWLHSGRLCASTRGPAFWRAEALPPRACRVDEAPRVRVAAAAAPIVMREDGVCPRKRRAQSDSALA